MHVDDEKLRCWPREEVLDFFGAEPTDIWSGDWSAKLCQIPQLPSVKFVQMDDIISKLRETLGSKMSNQRTSSR